MSIKKQELNHCWMGTIHNSIAPLKLSQIAIPGTHNSGCYNMAADIAKAYTQCQDKTFAEQLDMGIRYFDCRVAYWHDRPMDHFWFSHNDWNTKVPLQELIHDVDRFLSENTQEIIILEFRLGEGGTREGSDDIGDDISLEEFKKRLEPLNRYFINDSSQSIDELIRSNKRLLLLPNRSLNNDLSWFNKQHVNPLLEDLDSEIGKNLNYKDNNKLWLLQAILTMPECPKGTDNWKYYVNNSIHSNANKANDRIYDRLSHDLSWFNNLNVIFTDYANPKMSDAIIKINKNRGWKVEDSGWDLKKLGCFETNLGFGLTTLRDKLYMAFQDPGEIGGMFVAYCSNGEWKVSRIQNSYATLGIGLATFNGKLYMSYKGTGYHNGLYVASSSDGQNWDHNEIGSDAAFGIGLTTFNGKLYMGYKGTGYHNGLYVASSSDGQNWDHNEIGDLDGTRGIGLTTFNGKLYMAYEGTAGRNQSDKICVASSFDGRNWDTKQIPSWNAKAGIGLTTFNDKLYMAYQGINGLYIGASRDGQSWEDEQVGGHASGGWGNAAFGIGLTTFQGKLCMAFQGSGEGGLYFVTKK